MIDKFISVAHPYATAAFNFAVEQKNIDHWQKMLAFSALVTRNQNIHKLLFSKIAPDALSKLFIAICNNQIDKHGQNFIKIMAEHGRLLALPAVVNLFIKLRASLESTLEIDVLSVSVLSEKQRSKIIAAMEKHMLQKVRLNYKIDKSILGGIIIRANDVVIDGSILGRLHRLTDILQS